jgi:hypothetical protein
LESGTYFFHQFDGQVNQWQNLSSADDFCNQLMPWQSAMHWQNNWFRVPSFDDKPCRNVCGAQQLMKLAPSPDVVQIVSHAWWF